MTLALVATDAEHDELLDRVVTVLCPDAEHDGPCPVPWATTSVAGDSLPPPERVALVEAIEETNWTAHGDPERLDPPLRTRLLGAATDTAAADADDDVRAG
ncbi:hypothetical protein D7223_06055 [Micromonospora endolithica]|uniref:Uncharacterized protein n=1 Tax=Micromonospora endolithica TaxID=230091 RepID=A0A3A9ZL46_9ACTN|nr:hypothetical protein D7223_06055 [Micromonospora endolithica]